MTHSELVRWALSNRNDNLQPQMDAIIQLSSENARLRALSHRLAAWGLDAKRDLAEPILVETLDSIIVDARAVLAPDPDAARVSEEGE